MKPSHWVGALHVVLGLHCTANAQAINPNNPLYARPSADEVLLQLVDTLTEERGFCVDYPGFPASGVVTDYRESSWPMGAHTCKTNIPNSNVADIDQLFSLQALLGDDKRLRFTRLKVCIEVLTFRAVDAPGHMKEDSIREDAPLIANPCSDAPEQNFRLDTEGQIKPVLDPSKCLTIGKEAFRAGNRSPGSPWYRRDLNFSTCSEEASKRQRWRVLHAE